MRCQAAPRLRLAHYSHLGCPGSLLQLRLSLASEGAKLRFPSIILRNIVGSIVAKKNAPSAYRPEVIVDFSVEDGLLTVRLKNIGGSSAYQVKTEFDRPFHGLNGSKCISALRLFRRLEFMPPGKEFSQFVDTLANYAKRKEPMRLKATMTYRDREGNRYEETMAHDLRIYAELGNVKISRESKGG